MRNDVTTFCAMLGGVPVRTARRVLGLRWRNGLQLWRVAANTLNKQPWTNDKGWPSSLGVGLTTLRRKTKLVTNNLHKPRTWTDFLDKRPTLRNMVDWIGLTQDRNRWRALVNSVLNLRVR
jgi:hypothetical protein